MVPLLGQEVMVNGGLPSLPVSDLARVRTVHQFSEFAVTSQVVREPLTGMKDGIVISVEIRYR